MTNDQKTVILAAIVDAGMESAGNSIIAKTFNSTEVAGTVIAETKQLIPKPEILAMMTDASLINLLNFFDSGTEQARAFKYRWDSLENLDMTHPVTRGSIAALQASGIFSETEANIVLAYGERPKTTADELMGRIMTIEDVEEARS